MLARYHNMLRVAAPFCIFSLLLYGFYYHYVPQNQSPNANQSAPSMVPLEISIPKTIHQILINIPTFKPDSHTTTWQRSGWKLEYWSQDSCLQLAQDLHLTGPYAETFNNLPMAILRSDFCRYLVLFGKGGIYNDLDVHLMKPLPWKEMGVSEKGYNPPDLIIGLEGDASTEGLPRSPQFVQWTMASTPSHQALHNVLNMISLRTLSYLQAAAEPDADIDIMGWTGPSVWTDAIMEYLDCTEEQLNQLRDLKEGIRIKDVLILPKRAFAITQGEDHTSRDILVKHYFSGTWKKCRTGWLDRVMWWRC